MSDTKKSPARLDYIDYAKGFAILIMVHYHTFQDVENLFSSWRSCIMLSLFFVCTGYVMAYRPSWKQESFKSYFVKNLKGIMYPYLTFSLIAYAFYILWNLLHRTLDMQALFSRVIDGVCLFGYSVLWFLPTLFFAKLLYALLQKKRAALLAFDLLTVAAAALYSEWFSVKLYETLAGDLAAFLLRIMLGVLYLSFGALLYFLLERYVRNTPPYWALSAVCLAFSVLLMCRTRGVDFRWIMLSDANGAGWALSNPLYYFAASALACFAVVTLFYYMNGVKVLRLLAFFGENSLIVFATHTTWFIINVPGFLLVKLQLPVNMTVIFLAALALQTVVVILIRKYLPFLYKLPNKKEGR